MQGGVGKNGSTVAVRRLNSLSHPSFSVVKFVIFLSLYSVSLSDSIIKQILTPNLVQQQFSLDLHHVPLAKHYYSSYIPRKLDDLGSDFCQREHSVNSGSIYHTAALYSSLYLYDVCWLLLLTRVQACCHLLVQLVCSWVSLSLSGWSLQLTSSRITSSCTLWASAWRRPRSPTS